MIRHIREPKGQKSLYVNGEWISGYGKEFTSTDPWNGTVNWKGTSASESDVGRAVNSARKAQVPWAELPFEERATLLRTFAELVKENEDLAIAISKETGKPLWESKQEVAAVNGKVEISIQAAKERYPELKNGDAITRHRPYGVMGILGPFNLPAHLPNGHMIPALLAGNTIVLKASEQTPLVSEMIFQIWEQVGLPSGVINLLQGKGEVGQMLAHHDDIDGLLFTGSYKTGQKLLEHFAKKPSKILALEMGGNNPLILSSGKDVVDTIVQSAFITAGQRCTCARRLIVVDSKENRKTLDQLLMATGDLIIGHYNETPEPFMGPVIGQPAAVHALTKQAELKARGGDILIPFAHMKEGTGQVKPGIVDVTMVEALEDEELFAPFLQLIMVDTFEEALQEANKTTYGLAAGLLSTSEAEYKAFYQSIKAGIVNWNCPTTGASSGAPFGGVGRSGNHYPSAYYAADYCAYPVASMEKKG